MRTGAPRPATPFDPPFPGAVLVETHAHTAQVSACGYLPADRLVRLVAKHGYGALVVTDHNLPGRTDTPARCADFARGFELARQAGRKHGITVLPGMELRFDNEGFNDFLVFLPDEALYALCGLPAMGLRGFKKLADTRGMLVYQAHPFRPGLHPMPQSLLHGMEVHNGNPNHENRNHLARAYAQDHGMAMLSGSDLHERDGVRRGGIWATRAAIASPGAFVEFLRATPKPAMLTPPEDDW